MGATPSRRRALAAVAAGLVAAGVAGCAHDGQTLSPPPPGATVPATTVALSSTTAAVQPGVGSITADALVLASTAFVADSDLPFDFTCDGADLSPPLQWTGVPKGTVELAITVTDPDAKGFVHWALAGLPPEVLGVGQGLAPEGAIEAANSNGSVGWFGPCPPADQPAHHYVFTLYALSAPSGLRAAMAATDAIVQITATPSFGSVTLTGIYRRES